MLGTIVSYDTSAVTDSNRTSVVANYGCSIVIYYPYLVIIVQDMGGRSSPPMRLHA